MVYILALLISTCLILGQASWGGAVKQIAPIGTQISTMTLILKLAQSPKFWLGAIFYALGTLCYFLILSKAKFFSVQMTMTGLAIIFSTAVSYFYFKESISVFNFAGIVLILLGIFLVFKY
ncbi:hypothetical protein KC974_03720 [Candidatus Saccharibacteria bacterium]|jgi:uncharacterized membrane protein|nr:hypothetical protein [Candidatus Saccharibacteria bacterium]